MTASSNISPDMAEVNVALGERSYPILIGNGLLASAASHLTTVLPGAKFSIIADEAVRSHASQLQERLSKQKLSLGNVCFVPSGESSKCFSQLERICSALLDLGIERSHAVIACGGGVIGDLAGFAAAIVKRGVRLVQVPTTLLAQVNSSVGGKTGINSRHGKNLIGAFMQPSLVLTDLATLETLPAREFRAGYAEIVKYGALGNADFFNWLEENATQVFSQSSGALTYAVQKCCQMKAAIVAHDEFETGERALLNLGHTFGHAIEAWAGYSGEVLHGEAVVLGMVLAAQFSESLGLCNCTVALRLKAHLESVGFITDLKSLQRKVGRQCQLETLLTFMEQDKKLKNGQMTLILMRSVGDAFIAPDVSREAIRSFLEAQLR